MEIRLEDYNFYIRPGRTDMRKSSVGLALIVQDEMGLQPFERSVFLFCGTSRRIIKAIVWNGNGWLEIIKRLECGSSFKSIALMILRLVPQKRKTDLSKGCSPISSWTMRARPTEPFRMSVKC